MENEAFLIEIRPLASIEIIEAYQWYESQKDGLGELFFSDFDDFLSRLKRNPFFCSILENNIRQGRLSKFPYLIVHEVFGNTIVIFSVFNAYRDPGQKKIF